MAGWNNLPRELRWLIVDYIRTFMVPWPTYKPPYSGLSLVSREWHGYFSHEVFRIIVLDQDRLDDFAKLVGTNKQRQTYVNRFVLRIKLPEYDCSVCQVPEDPTTTRANDIIFINTLRRFMAIISTWEADSGDDVELDLGVYSPSDCRHGFRDCRLSLGYPYGADREVHQRHAAALSNLDADNKGSVCAGWNRACNGDPPCGGYEQTACHSRRSSLTTLRGRLPTRQPRLRPGHSPSRNQTTILSPYFAGDPHSTYQSNAQPPPHAQ